jgi:hypothetical protein
VSSHPAFSACAFFTAGVIPVTPVEGAFVVSEIEVF